MGIDQDIRRKEEIKAQIKTANTLHAKIEDICIGESHVIPMIQGLNFPGEVLTPCWHINMPLEKWTEEIHRYVLNMRRPVKPFKIPAI